jgi:hypothetical protein
MAYACGSQPGPDARSLKASLPESLCAPLPEDVASLAYSGFFGLARELIALRLKKSLPSPLADRLRFELCRLSAIEREYVYTFAEAAARMREFVEGFEDSEMEILWREGAADWRFVEGEMRFAARFAENILNTLPEYSARRFSKAEASPSPLDEAIARMKERGEASAAIRVRHGLKLKGPAEKPGEPLLVHLPLPIESDMAEGFRLLSAGPGKPYVAPPRHPSRTACFRVPALRAGEEFFVEYEYTARSRYVQLDFEKADPVQPSFETGEILPHVAFGPYLKSLAKEVGAGAANALERAHRFYSFVTQNVMYSYMREYISLPGIVSYAASGLKGDCGVQALLFIALCRVSGIPAAWQSGFYACPGSEGRHDWARFYVAPYGWLHCDCSFGGAAWRAGDMERWGFYFGNMDPFRTALNNAFQHPFDPPKAFLRADPYDSQIGEAEYPDGPVLGEGLGWSLSIHASLREAGEESERRS